MKHFLAIIILFLTISCSNNNTSIGDLGSNKNVDWLIGEWIRVNESPNKRTFENWKKISDNEYLGLGCTLENNDTTFKENLRLVNSENNWVLEVRGVNEKMTPFVITNFTDSSFTCENEQNEFPKIIKYSARNNLLEAVISADSVEVLFTFSKK